MRRVRQYEIQARGRTFTLDMPTGATILGVAARSKRTLQLWALCDTANPPEQRQFGVVRSETDIPAGLNIDYVGTALFRSGRVAVHVFEVL